MLPQPINLPKWLEENAQLLQPPINNYCVYNGDFTVMIVGGPNARTDFHVNETPEYFYQHKGAMILRVVEPSSSSSPADPDADAVVPSTPKFRDIVIREGDMFLLPGSTPHSPIRFGNTVGVVVEQRRPPGTVDRLRWYCGSGVTTGCGVLVHEEVFVCTDLGTQVKKAVEAFRDNKEARTCKACGQVAEVVHAAGVNKDPNFE